MTLLLAEELVLLCMDDEAGHCEVASDDMARGVALALVFELTLSGALAVEGEKFALQRTTGTGDQLLDLAAQGATALTPVAAVEKLAAEDLLEAILTRLVARGVLRDAEVWAPGVHLPKDPHPEAAVRQRLREVLVEGRDATDHDAALVALLHHLDIVGMAVSEEPTDVTAARAAEVASRSRPMRSYQDGAQSRKSWWNGMDLLDLVVQGLNIFN
ncbi:GPP34 family phosphoprotein [Ornithinimicrobium sp. F0845]|uniref:GOLPH3/VPS74 family protein n=1 Tax=Ornithinimicrobium sp. F0845 TaxID=2926412 RepID=UPI001FF5175D|nr:GPP34 family phosphoprotein [Ornithinimicrobium sp. F0845]MCK0112044.1 GPP34 family phosphoprotein [Ornithinimicrobium sp. F0845]